MSNYTYNFTIYVIIYKKKTKNNNFFVFIQNLRVL